MPNWKKVIVSGSDASLNSLNVNTYISASSFSGKFTGSLQGSSSYALTSSYVQNAQTASYVVSASYAVTASNAITASYALYAAVAPNLGTTTTFTQATSASTWTFIHNLNTYTPQITVYDYGKNVIIPQNIAGTDANTVTINFNASQSGYAVISNGGGLVITGSSYYFTQASASSTWLIEHPLNTRTPIVQVYDPTYTSILTEYITALSNTLVSVTLPTSTTGFAVLSNGGNLFISGSSARLTQSIAAVTWSFTHSLNTKYPVVQVYDSTDTVIIPATITAIDTNTTQLTFATPTTGVAVAEFSGIQNLQDNTVSSSYARNADTASFALNGGVTRIFAGPNITLAPTNGLGQVTITANLSGSTSFNTATGSYGSFYDTTTQTNPVANIPRSMSFNTTDITNGVSISGSTNPFNTYIKTENPGVYNIQFSAQLDKTDSGKDEVVIWLRKNGIDLTDTATTVTLNGNDDKVVAAWNWFTNSTANDYYQIIWYSADTDLRLLAETAGGGHPGIPSVILTANRVDTFLSNTGSFSGSFNGNFNGSGSGTFIGSFTGSLFGTASQAVSSSYAGTASLAPSYTLTSSFLAFTSSVNATTGALNVTTGALNATTGALNATTGALNSRTGSYATTGSNTFIGTQTITGNGTVTGDWTVQGNLTAQTFIISSSVSYFTESFSSGSTKFGDDTDDTHQFTGSVRMTGSLDITGSVTANYGFTGSLFGTSSWAQNTVGAPYYVLTSSFTTYSSSISTRETNLEATASAFVVASASFSSSIVTLTNASASLATNSGSNSTRFTTLENASASFASQSGSNSTRFTILELASGSLSASVATLINMSASYAIASGSDSARVTRLEGTASAFAIASASFSSSIVTLTNASASFAAVSTSYSIASGSLSSRVTVLETASGSLSASVATLINASASFATVSASYSNLSGSFRSGSFTGSFIGIHTGSLFGTASQALTASSVNPLTQIVSINGGLNVTGSTNLSGSAGTTILSANIDTIVFSGSFTSTGSVSITGSVNVSGGITGSLLGTSSYAVQALSSSFALTASYVASIANLSTTQIATGSVTASVSGSDATFRVVSGSNTFLFVSSSGLTTVSGTFAVTVNNVNEFLISSTGSSLGNALTDTHNVTGSFNITGSLRVTGNTTSSLTSSQAISSSYALTASYALNSTVNAFTHTQATSASAWTINHALNSRNLNVTVYDFGYNVIIPQNISNTDGNTSIVTFPSAQSGYAVLNPGGLLVTGSTAVFSASAAAVTWSFTHSLNTRVVNLDVYDSSYNQVIPSRVTLTGLNTAEITFATATSGFAIASVNGNSGSVISSQNLVLTSDATNTTRYMTFAASESGVTALFTDANITLNPSTNTLTVGSLTETSTIELKQNIKNFVTPLAKFMALKPVSYKWKANKRKDIGFIAEQVQEIFPEIVAEDGKSMSYTKLTPILIDMVQRQQKMIEDMNQEIKELKKHINRT